MKRCMSILAATVLLLCMLPMTAFAQTDVSLEIAGGADAITMSLYGDISLEYSFISDDSSYNEAISWSTDNETILLVSDNGVIAIGTGTATVTAISESGLTDSVTVTVFPAIAWNGVGTRTVYLNTLYTERTFALTVPESGSYTIYSASDIDPTLWVMDANGYWVGSADDENGSNFELTIDLIAGESYYLYMYVYSQVPAAFDVTVEKATANVITDKLAFVNDTITVNVLDVFLPEFTFIPESDNETLALSSSNEMVVMVADGIATGVAPGTATLTLTSSTGDTDTINVTVQDLQELKEDIKTTAVMTNEILARSYLFIPTTTDTYLFQSYATDNADPAVMLTDMNGTIVAQCDDSNFGLNFAIESELTQGTGYFLTVTTFSGIAATYDFAVTKPMAATSVTAYLTPDQYVNRDGDTYYVSGNDNLYIDVMYGDALSARGESYSCTSSDETVLVPMGMGEAQVVGVGTAVITVTSETGLTDTITIVVSDSFFGDVNMDGACDVMDVLAVYALVSGESVAKDTIKAIAEINGDNQIDIMDVMTLFTEVSGS